LISLVAPARSTKPFEAIGELEFTVLCFFPAEGRFYVAGIGVAFFDAAALAAKFCF